VRQHAPDGRLRGRDSFAWEAVGDFDGQFTQAVATQRHLAIGGTFAGQGHHQRTRRRCDCFRSTPARSILQPCTALGREPAKRAIDQLNLNRHRLVQAIDVAIGDGLEPAPTAVLATESPGMVLDRLSVLVIRRTRTAEASAHDPAYADRLPALDAQLAALVAALDAYLDELRAGRRTFFAHDPLKLYVAPADLTRGDGNRPG